MRKLLTGALGITWTDGMLSSFWLNHSKLFANIFIVSYLYCIGFWLCPDSGWRSVVLEPVSQAVSYLGLWQQYRVFAPVRRFNVYFDAEVAFEDGSKSLWHYPRPEKMGFWDKIRNERFRKLANDNLNWRSQNILWPDFARYVVRQVQASSGKKPVFVSLIRNFQDIPPPYLGQLLPMPPYESEVFFEYIVLPEDLR